MIIIHLVREGEKLSGIAARYRTTTDAIVDRNKHRPSVQLPSGERVFASLAAGDELIVGGRGFANMSNPAADYCVDLGGSFPTPTSSQCMLPDGTVCEQWALFRGQCPGYPGKFPELDNKNQTPSKIPVVPTSTSQPEPMISKPMIAGGLAVLGVVVASSAIIVWSSRK